MRRLFTLIVAAGLISIAAVGSAAAGGPDIDAHDSWHTEYIEDVDLCSFPVALQSTVHEVITPSGAMHWQGFETFINETTGTAFGGTWSENWRITAKGIQGSGIFWKMAVPGYGMVLIDAGYRLYGGPPDYELIRAHGPSFDADPTMVDAFCALLE